MCQMLLINIEARELLIDVNRVIIAINFCLPPIIALLKGMR